MDTPLLWHIPLSHYNAKVRWALDYFRTTARRCYSIPRCAERRRSTDAVAAAPQKYRGDR